MVVRLVQSKSAKAAKNYFRESLNRPDYYGRSGVSPGLWFGEGARRLGLTGQVSQADFFALADNRYPASYDEQFEDLAANDNAPKAGTRLTVRDKANRRPGYDFVFSPPKSVSSLWARADAFPELKQRLVAAFRQSVIETLREDVEPEMKTRLRRNGQDGDIVTGNMVGSLFLHESARPLDDGTCDPHLHIHAYCFNATWAAHEQRWQAAQLGDLHLDRPHIEAAFEARLARHLEAMNLAVERHAKGWEIAGVPQSIIAKDSRRTEEIKAEAKKRKITDAKEKGELGAKFRRSKEAAKSPEEIEQDWHERLTDDERRTMNQLLRKAAAGGTPRQPWVTAKQAMDHAEAHVFVREGAVSEKNLMAAALRYGVGSVLPEEVKNEVDGRGLIRATIGGRKVVTNPTALADDRGVVDFAKAGRGRCEPLLSGTPHLFAATPENGRRVLDDGQKAAVEGLLDSIDRNVVTLYLGKAGVGKTTTLQELKLALNERGRDLLAFAPTSRASRGVLKSKGFAEADTLESLRINEELQARIRGNVVLVDEGGLAGSKALRELFDMVGKQRAEGYDTRVAVTGDPRQHRGVPRGSVLHLLEHHAGLTPVRLSKIRRQIDPRHRELVEDLSEGRIADGVAKLDKHGFIQEIADDGERYKTMASEFADRLEAGDTAILLSPTHKEGRLAVAAVREELKTRGRLGGTDESLIRYESKGLTDAEKQDAVHYEAGDMVQWSKFAPGFKRGEQVRVVRREDDEVRVAKADGRVMTLPLELAPRFELYRTSELAVAEGERLRVTRNGYALTPDGMKHRLNNGELVRVGVSESGDLVDERGWIIGKEYGHLAPAILTSHASQGMDEHWVFVAQSTMSRGASSAEQVYVSASRGVKGVRIYTDDKEAFKKAVARSEQRLSAIEVWQAREAEEQAAREREGERKWRQRYLAEAEAARERAASQLREQASRRPIEEPKRRVMA